jgi:ribosomal subunit interface protein
MFLVMKLQIVARHIPLTNTLRDHIKRRFLEMLARHFDRESCELHVEIASPVGEGKHRFCECQARLTVPKGLLVVHERGRDAYAAVDAVERKLARQVIDWRDRVLIGSRFPKKYFVARRAEESPPALLSEEPSVLLREGPDRSPDRDRPPVENPPAEKSTARG